MSWASRDEGLAAVSSEKRPLQRSFLQREVERLFPLEKARQPAAKSVTTKSEPLRSVTTKSEPFVAMTSKERVAAYRARKRAAKEGENHGY
jgi:hypothetical protein